MVRKKVVKNRDPDRWKPTRRELLGAAAIAGVGLCADLPRGIAQETRPATSQSIWQPPGHPLAWIEQHPGRSRVIDIRSRKALDATVVDRIELGEMLDQGMQRLTGELVSAKAWRSVLGSAERIVVKFNSVGADVIGTNSACAELLFERLTGAGYTPESITLVEAPAYMNKRLGTQDPVPGWGKSIRVGEGREPLARYLLDADAIINVPFLKTHQIAGISACMKNLSHAVIRHPARYHANGCSPYVGQVIISKEVSSRIKLNLINALRVVVNRGPDAREEDVVGYGGLLMGFDPLAVDGVGLDVLAGERRRLKLPTSFRVPYIESAAQMGIGRWRPTDVERVAIETSA